MISVIIPAYNEEAAIGQVIKEVPDRVSGEPVEIIVVDNGSKDRTSEKAKAAGAKVFFIKERGKFLAIKEGIKNTSGEKIILIDGDGEHDPKYIPYMIDLLEDCEMVNAYSVVKPKNVGVFAYLIIKITKLSAPVFGNVVGLGELLNGYRAIRRKDWERLEITSDNFIGDLEIDVSAIENDFRIIKFPIIRRGRIGGVSRYLFSSRDFIHMLIYLRKKKAMLDSKERRLTIIEHHP